MRVNRRIIIGKNMRRVRTAAKQYQAGYYQAWTIESFDPVLAMRRNHRSHLKGTRMEMKSQFFRASDEQFKFLKHYDFRPKIKKMEAGTYIRVYQNSTTAVKVALEWPEQYLYVRLCQFVDGRLQDNPTVIRQSSKLYCFNLENLLLLTEPDLIVKPAPYEELTSEQMEKTLCIYANAVEKYASAILRGNFQLFSRLESIVKESAGRASSRGYVSKVGSRRPLTRTNRLQHVSANEGED